MNHQVKRRRVPVHGVLLLDKPAGISSTQALAKAKWLLNAEKAGHTGTLDPFATGLLPLCFGEATKYASDLLDADKSYEATVHLGVTTSTGDTEGEVLESREVRVTREQIDSALSHFNGKISQTPPMYSALKVDGKPLYAYAREGITLERKSREILIHEIELMEFDFTTVKIRVRCSKGTYVRTLAEDIGTALGCGAHVAQLRRVASGQFGEADAVSLERLQQLRDAGDFEALDALVLPPERAVQHLPAVVVAEAGLFYLCQGQPVMVATVPPERGMVRVLDADGEFRGVGEITDDRRVAPRRMMAAHTAR